MLSLDTAATERGEQALRQVGEAFLAALCARDFEQLEACLDSRVEFRALTPLALREAGEATGAVSYLRRWFGVADEFEVLATETGWIAGRLRIAYRIRLRKPEGWRVVEQQAYCDVREGRIEVLDLLCSGFLPETPAVAESEQAPTRAPRADAVLDASGHGCGTLTPLLRARLRELQSGDVLEVLADDPSTREGMPAWSRLTGHELLAVQEDGAKLRFYVRKK